MRWASDLLGAATIVQAKEKEDRGNQDKKKDTWWYQLTHVQQLHLPSTVLWVLLTFINPHNHTVMQGLSYFPDQ